MSKISEQLFNTNVEIIKLKDELDLVNKKRMSIQTTLAKLSLRVRSSNTSRTRLSPEEYRAICNEQSKLKTKLLKIEEEGMSIKKKIRELNAIETYERIEARKSISALNESKTLNQIGVNEIKIISLRDKWLNFAEDQTRVNSMRVMAAQFARELTELLASAIE